MPLGCFMKLRGSGRSVLPTAARLIGHQICQIASKNQRLENDRDVSGSGIIVCTPGKIDTWHPGVSIRFMSSQTVSLLLSCVRR